VPSGTFQGRVSVQLRTTITDTTVRYTTDGMVPTASSAVYSEPLTFTTTTQVRAQAYRDGKATGAPGSARYVARTFDATHDLPLVVMDAYGQGNPRHSYHDVSFMVMGGSPGSITRPSQLPEIATRASFRLADSLADNTKAPYRIELRDNRDDPAGYPVLGMPADSDWNLVGPFQDKTLVRDAFALSLARDLGLRAPRFAFVELYLNLDQQPLAADDYQGVYLLVETIKVSPERVNIQKLTARDITEPAITGGYLVRFNLMEAKLPVLRCAREADQPCWYDLELVAPTDPQPQQHAWITDYVQKFHAAVRSADSSDPLTGYPAYISVDSFVDYLICSELSRQGNAYVRDTYFSKDRGGKLVAGPVAGSALGYGALPMPADSAVRGWQYQSPIGGGATGWYQELMRDPAFRARFTSRWNTLRRGMLSDSALKSRMEMLATQLNNAAQRNFQKWPNLTTANVAGFETQVTKTWQDQLLLMRTFLIDRAAWLDSV
jgi:hypothetical protein